MQESKKECVQKALIEGNFPQFFSSLQKVNSNYERNELMQEAIQVGLQQKNVKFLKQLAKTNFTIELQFGAWDSENLLGSLLQALVDLDEFNFAVGFIVFNNDERLESSKAWYLLAEILLSRNDLAKVKKAYSYIKDPYQRFEIAQSCLKKALLPEKLLDWLAWFSEYIRLENYVSPSSFQEIIDAIVNAKDFSFICTQLQKMENSIGKRELFYKLYLHLILTKEIEKCSILNAMLPEQLDYLSKIQQLSEDEELFWIFDKLESHDVQHFILSAVEQLVLRQAEDNAKNVVKKIIGSANLSTKCLSMVIHTACEVCLNQNQLDVVIGLLPYLERFPKEKILLSLLKHKLHIPQYNKVLENLENIDGNEHKNFFSISSEKESILRKIPKELVEAERQRRATKAVSKIEKEFSSLTHVHRQHTQYEELTTSLDELIRYKQYKTGFQLCQKLVASKARDVYVKQLLQGALDIKDYILADKIANLLCHNEEKQVWVNFFRNYQQNNYREALKVLMKSRDKDEFSDFMLDCVKEILSEEDSPTAINFLISIRIFSLSESYFSDDPVNIIKRKLARALLLQYKNDKDIKKLIQSLEKRKIIGFESFLLKELLRSNRFTAAFNFLNKSVKEVGGSVRKLPEKLEKTVEKYLENDLPSVDFLDALSLIEDESLKTDITRKINLNTSRDLSIDTIKYIAHIPVKEIKDKYLIDIIAECIKGKQFDSVNLAIQYLSSDKQEIWLKILDLIKNQKFTELINFLLSEAINQNVFLHWVIQQWLETKSPSSLLEHLKKFNRVLQEIAKEKQLDFFSEAYQKQVNKRQIFEILFCNIFHQWSQLLLQAKEYDALASGIHSLLPLEKQLNIYVRIFDPLREIIKKLLDEENYRKAFEQIQFIMHSNEDLSKDLFDRLLMGFLKNNLFELSHKLIELTQKKYNYWQKEAIIKICERYMERANYNEVIALLRNYKGDFVIRKPIKNWIVQLIKNKKINQAVKFIDNLLENSDETIFVLFIRNFISKSYLVLAQQYLQEKIHTPGVKLRLQSELQESYLQELKKLIGQDRGEYIFQLSQKFNKFLKFIKNAEKQAKANLVKNEIIVELRGQLDKAFLAFYRDKYGEPPIRGGKPCNVYFPVVPELKGKTVRERLQDYFQQMLKLPHFDTDFPELFQYLEKIQPLHNADYAWLEQLYALANLQKHDSELALEPELDNKKIKMEEFLPTVLDGVTELLIKLFNPKKKLADIKKLQLSRYVRLEPSSMTTGLTEYNGTFLGNTPGSRDVSKGDISSRSMLLLMGT